MSCLEVVVVAIQQGINSAFPGQLRGGGRRKKDESNTFIWCSFAFGL